MLMKIIGLSFLSFIIGLAIGFFNKDWEDKNGNDSNDK